MANSQAIFILTYLLTLNPITMKSTQAATSAQLPFNKVVKDAYFKLLKDTKKLLATLERHELRCILEREDRSPMGFGTKVHEIISPLLYLSLECEADELTIHFGFELMNGNDSEYSTITSRFVRMLYSYTAKEQTNINIERCVNTDYVIYDCSVLYETVEERMRHHTLKVIPHKPASEKRKAVMAVA
ncbi:hypothetical protein [Mucilaginibacter boryungensis]|uniref:Uncharacterized protein n=1 Tax=Mucilaginibacter boryungensis TaxID=768480 RepID=A0ABR9XNN3_9SPHI|nr:hypothetical protein [Mucilaginibacter boryungensis]MBE9668719.1 hypothetical protein [Mucilaginibacter boryungensis]